MQNAMVELGIREVRGCLVPGEMLGLCCPRGDRPHKAVVECRGNRAGTLQAALNQAISKTGLKMTLDECQPVFTLIRTDTTHDLSQKAEKVCFWWYSWCHLIYPRILSATCVDYAEHVF